ncbi:Site-specific recombinase XerD [Natronincola peptidivorans]|uniref:Site-specific recombinase XerD n=1 Tax=Natronincola peptidivorans TaxID=426128 RepID=A0A1I0E221_9FIRM|nr:site-specific integrase [Natronincola peptidivorans]SET38763.1 Site-specific recombinase XerD [Natronincola peptidivorans]
MASIKQRKNSWLITVSNGYDNQGKKITKTKTVKKPVDMTDKKWEKELQKLALEFEREVEKGLSLDNNIKLADFVEKWLSEYAAHNLEERTLASYKAELNGKILPCLGHIKLSKLRPDQILSFLNNLLEDGCRLDGKPGPYSNRIIKYQHQILSSILQTAVYWQIIEDNPCRRVKVPKHNNAPQQVKHFDEEQTILLLEAIKDEDLKYQVVVNLALFGGLRKGELLGLQWPDLNLEEGTIRISRANSYLKELGTFTKAPKTKSSIRTISIPSNVVKLLREYKVWQNQEKLGLGDAWDEDWDKNKWILCQWNGKPMNYDSPNQWLTKFIKRYNDKIQENPKIKKEDKHKYLLPVLSLHKLRHTSATLLVSERVDIRTVANRLGHAQSSTTLNFYSHALRASDTRAASTLEGLLDKNKEVAEVKKA